MRMYGEQFTKDWLPFYGLRLAPWIEEHYHWPRFHKLMQDVFPFAHYA